jgi:hypothetical protein
MSEIEYSSDSLPLYLTQNKVAYISKEDAELTRYRWHTFVTHDGTILAGHNYKEGGKLKQAKLHREVARRVLGRRLNRRELVVFKDGNSLNCRRNNLEVRTQATLDRRNSKRNKRQEIVKQYLLLVPDTKKVKGFLIKDVMNILDCTETTARSYLDKHEMWEEAVRRTTKIGATVYAWLLDNTDRVTSINKTVQAYKDDHPGESIPSRSTFQAALAKYREENGTQQG